MSYMEQFTEVHDVLAVFPPDTAHMAVGAHASGYVDVADYHRAFFFLQIGESVGAGTINVTVQQAQDTAGTGAKPLTTIAGAPKSPTQIVAADAGNYVGIEIRSPELDVSDYFHCLQITVTVGIAVYYYSGVLFGIVSRYEPVGTADFQEVVS